MDYEPVPKRSCQTSEQLNIAYSNIEAGTTVYCNFSKQEESHVTEVIMLNSNKESNRLKIEAIGLHEDN
ncbi:hypothetical protein L596_029665 [Steinernema carpocapsae]|uniref:Uncharacterized protein n=1 Tax=Steinernema carpocapsae TaxID=34508 RepID=A0A4U5LVB1_STECR|nr:hypothetical protein L596_029665 [Steinernema carpocapsae]